MRLAIALDAVGRRDKAYELLANRDDLDSDALGTMAEGSSASGCCRGAKRTLRHLLLTTPKVMSSRSPPTTSRNLIITGINLAFLEFVFRGDRPAARERATKVLEICLECERQKDADEWLQATKGEAQLILGNQEPAFEAYSHFVAAGNQAWKLCSTYLNAERSLGRTKAATSHASSARSSAIKIPKSSCAPTPAARGHLGRRQ